MADNYTYANDINEVRVTWRYKNALDAEVFNEHFVGVLKDGVYQKDDTLLVKVSNTEVTVNKFVAYILNENVAVVESPGQTTVYKDILTKIDIRASKNLTNLDYTKPIIVVEFTYSQSETITPTIKAIAYGDFDSTKQIKLGKCLYRDNAGTKDELYGFDEVRTLDDAPMLEMEEWFKSFTAIVTGDMQITVRGGLLEGDTIADLILNYGSGVGEKPLPTNGYHRYDFIYVDEGGNLAYVAGQEEADAGEDEYPKPDKTQLALYSFPVCYIYVTENLSGTRVFQPADIENIIPRFMRKLQVLSGSLSDIIISTQEDFEAYFGNDPALYPGAEDQGGTTPGLYGDGWICEYNNSVKSVYVPNKRIVIKNQFDANGNQVPYKLYTRALLQTDSEIYQASGVFIKYQYHYASFRAIDQTNMTIDEYTASLGEILSENTHYTDSYANNYGNQVPFTEDMVVACYSKTYSIVDRRQLITIKKDIREDVSINSNPGPSFAYDNIDIEESVGVNIATNDFDATEYQLSQTPALETFKRMIVVFIDSNDNIKLRGYKFNLTTKKYEHSFAEFNLTTSGPGSAWSNVRITHNNTYLLVSGKIGSSINLFVVPLSAADDNFQFSDYTGWNTASGEAANGTSTICASPYSLFFDTNSALHIAGIDGANDIDYFVGAKEASPGVDGFFQNFTSTTFDGTGGLPNVTNASNTTKIGLHIDISQGYKYITYCENNSTMDCLFTSDDVTWTKSTLLASTSGHQSVIKEAAHPSGSGTIIYIVYNIGSTNRYVNFAELVWQTGNTIVLSSVQTLLQGIGAQYDHIDFVNNSDNTFFDPADGVTLQSLLTVVAFEQSAASGGYSLQTAVALNKTVKTWNTNTVDLTNHTLQGIIAGFSTDYLHLAYYDSVWAESYLLRLHHNITFEWKTGLAELGVAPDPLGLTDVVIAPDFAFNVRLDVNVDANDMGGPVDTPAISLANMIQSDVSIKLINSAHRPTIRCNHKTFRNDIKLYIENFEFSSPEEIFSKLVHCSVIGGHLKLPGSDKTFNDCYNINVVTFVDKQSYIGNGDFDV